MVERPRFVVCTFNLWADAHWPARKEPMAEFIRLHRPDILGLQEVRPVTLQLLDEQLPAHSRVDDPFEGWQVEGNLYWNEELFELVEYGAVPIGTVEELRRLFWVRLRLPGQQNTLFVSTAHYTYPGRKREEEEGVNPRLAQARATAAALAELSPPQEALIFMGDLNDFIHPLRILREAGLQDSFTALGRLSPVTRPTLPTMHEPEPQVNDWILHRGPLRPMACDVVDFFYNRQPPSDHKPLLVTYRWE